MVTSYYIMKMQTKKANILAGDSYDNLFNNDDPILVKNIKNKICRVCLQKGSIPIFGFNEEIPQALAIFADLQVNKDDVYPKLLCEICHNFIKKSILFRKKAKQSDEILRRPMIKEEEIINPENDYSDDGNENEDAPLKCDEDKIKQEKKGQENSDRHKKEKLSPKVTCHVCKKVINRSYIKEHITMHEPDHYKYVCEVCGKSFRLRCAYTNHKLRHRSDFPYKCHFCPYRGKYSGLLKTHMRTHSGEYRYMCTECPARFLFKSNLNSHMLKHKQPEFKCDTCKRAFHSKLMLQRHFEADHLGIKNHVCSDCGKAFGYRNAMMKHQRHVHKREKLMFGRMPAYLQAEQNQLDCSS